MTDDDLDAFDLAGIDRDVNAYHPPARPSQRREARKLTPLIERVLAANPAVKTSAVRDILERNRRSGSLPDTATFNREFGRVCREVRARIEDGKVLRKPARSGKRQATTTPMPDSPSSSTDPVTHARAAMPANDRPHAVSTHPLTIFSGGFGGLVFKHGPPLRDFFSAVEHQRDDATLRSLAQAAANDAASRARLADLHPKDRSIFEAALVLP